MNLFSYIVASDSGLAPNPFWSLCTLACCKPAIRRKAKKGDIVVGLTPKAKGNKIVYVMRVTADKLTFKKYWKHPKFKRKKPDFNSDSNKIKCGDNIYSPLPNGRFKQHPSKHSNKDGTENKEQKKKDLRGKFVLVSKDFVYYGLNAKNLPKRFHKLIIGRGHRRFSSSKSKRLVEKFERFFKNKLPRGRRGMPALWEARSSCSTHKQKEKAGRSCG